MILFSPKLFKKSSINLLTAKESAHSAACRYARFGWRSRAAARNHEHAFRSNYDQLVRNAKVFGTEDLFDNLDKVRKVRKKAPDDVLV